MWKNDLEAKTWPDIIILINDTWSITRCRRVYSFFLHSFKTGIITDMLRSNKEIFYFYEVHVKLLINNQLTVT